MSGQRLRSVVIKEYNHHGNHGDVSDDKTREVLMAAKAPKKDGKGYEYPVIGHVVGLDGKIRGERKRLLYMAGY